MKRLLLTVALMVAFCGVEARAERLVANIAVGSGTVANVNVGTVTVQMDIIQLPDRVSIELCSTTTTVINCGYSINITTSVNTGILGKALADDGTQQRCWDQAIGNRLNLYCALALGSTTFADVVPMIVIQRSNGRN